MKVIYINVDFVDYVLSKSTYILLWFFVFSDDETNEIIEIIFKKHFTRT